MPSHGTGPIPAKIMLVGEAWGEHEERAGEPFVGPSGGLLNKMLHSAGIMRSEVYVTNVVNARPLNNDLRSWIAFSKKEITPKHVPWRDWWVLPLVVEGYQSLLKEIEIVQPNVIVTLGNLSTHALKSGIIKLTNNGPSGILKWRASQLRADVDEPLPPKLIPTIHPAAVSREWTYLHTVVNDFRRVRRHSFSRDYSPPEWNFIIRPSLDQVIETLQQLLFRLEQGEELWLDLDLETAAGHIECCGISWSRLDAICIPFLNGIEPYWSEEEESLILYYIYRITTHRRVKIRWQNGLYDAQYIHRRWLFVPRGAQDTMISQHSLFSDDPKSLAFQASTYADWYIYWKDEGKKKTKGVTDEVHWRYNCQDCVYTREVGEVELMTAEKLGLKQIHDWQQEMFYPVLRAMLRGVRVIEPNAAALAMEVQEQISIREAFMERVIGTPLNINSPAQMMSFFYDDLQQPPVMTRAKKGKPSHRTCDDEALALIGRREPILSPITTTIADLRTLNKFLGDFICAKRDFDGRMRCSFNIGGSESGKSAPKTFRLSSSKNPFGSGMNLQTIPGEKSKSVGKWSQRHHFEMIGAPYDLPNLRSMFGPDPGFTFFDEDLDRADLHVFVWEIGDELYKEVLRKGVDAHLLHVYLLDNQEPPPLDELVESHPKYPDHRGPRKLKREFSKIFCHATDYVGSARTVAAHTGRLVHEVDRARKRYLSVHPTIEPYWKDIERQILRRHYVENKFGYRWYIFDREDGILPEAVAWIPQSTVSNVINKIWLNLHRRAPEIEVLLQVHDSLAGQFPTHRRQECLQLIKENSNIVIPYDDPLIIPTGIGTSEVSWGEC